ncbi:bifunctional DNA primase/helicase, partial [Paraburkholderia aspalathi]|nr:bifunctional DNA primase/helicase [Paraburkholderia aspalathi]
MKASLHHDITQRLLSDYGFKENGTWLQQGLCPECGKKELFTRADNPWVIRCGRANNCGWEGAVKDLYRDLFDNWSDRYPVVETNPHAAADAYMQFSRGFEPGRVRGWYTQEHYHDSRLKAGT